ncbi:hypothetical protein BDZ94DRAFT_483430 [Collybia nuda]|uniref:Uncharacterized protein n=1 Tax=Collybia nuda TaxID=64659 RepID=A0A9P6C8H4_9AGAR|nr:hypothetical protein BDZ94DRAFT_662671 [Collybia nuda]KAF9455977.1 hypothetical protein BDZ94DRAFT_483430 [Collybia nuda]
MIPAMWTRKPNICNTFQTGKTSTFCNFVGLISEHLTKACSTRGRNGLQSLHILILKLLGLCENQHIIFSVVRFQAHQRQIELTIERHSVNEPVQFLLTTSSQHASGHRKGATSHTTVRAYVDVITHPPGCSWMIMRNRPHLCQRSNLGKLTP